MRAGEMTAMTALPVMAEGRFYEPAQALGVPTSASG